MKHRVAFFIDGFNMYHGLHELRDPKLKWLNLRKLASYLIRPRSEAVANVKYYSAFANHYENTPDRGKLIRHRAYVRALECKGVECIMGNFAKRDLVFSNGRYKARWKRREEKQTDVSIAVHVVSDAFDDRYDTAVIVSCDTDMLPVYRFLVQRFPEKNFVAASPPGRQLHDDLRRAATGSMRIKRSQVERSLFGREVRKGGRVVAVRPKEYAPG